MRTDFPNLSPLDVVRALARADAPVLLDIRLPEDVADFPGIIPGAVAVAYDDIDAQLALARPNGAIVICHKGLKLSAGVTARLLSRDCAAWRIAGGQMGWLAAGLPVTQTQPPAMMALPLGATVGEAVAAWAVLRFMAPRVELLEVPRDDLAGVADRFGAVLPVIEDAPELPGLAAFMAEAATPSGFFAAQLAGAGPRPSDAFACLDAGYRGRLDAISNAASASGASSDREGAR